MLQAGKDEGKPRSGDAKGGLPLISPGCRATLQGCIFF